MMCVVISLHIKFEEFLIKQNEIVLLQEYQKLSSILFYLFFKYVLLMVYFQLFFSSLYLIEIIFFIKRFSSEFSTKICIYCLIEKYCEKYRNVEKNKHIFSKRTQSFSKGFAVSERDFNRFLWRQFHHVSHFHHLFLMEIIY